MNESPSAPEPIEHGPVSPTDAVKPQAALPPSILALGFIAIALIGVLIAISLKSKPATATESKPGEGLGEAKATLQAIQSNIDQERAKLGLSPIYSQGSEDAELVASRISEDAATLVDMAKGVRALIADKDAELDQRTREWTESLKLQGILRDQINKLQADLNKALIEGSEVSGLRSRLEAANQRILSLNDELRRLSESSGDLARVAAERDSLRARVEELERRLSQASLFAGTESELFAEAVQLFRSLRELEGKSDSEIATAYSQFGAQLGANVLDKIDFPTGVSDISPERGVKIESFPAQAPDNSLLLVVGYASETGNEDDNRTLSSNRATAVARVLNQVKRPGQRVQAVYLGQTDRFGSQFPERNQISEVWQIVPKSE